MNVVAALCHRFPEAALVARRFLDKSGKRAAETKPRKGHAFDPTKLVQYLHETVGAPRAPSGPSGMTLRPSPPRSHLSSLSRSLCHRCATRRDLKNLSTLGLARRLVSSLDALQM